MPAKNSVQIKSPSKILRKLNVGNHATNQQNEYLDKKDNTKVENTMKGFSCVKGK